MHICTNIYKVFKQLTCCLFCFKHFFSPLLRLSSLNRWIADNISRFTEYFALPPFHKANAWGDKNPLSKWDTAFWLKLKQKTMETPKTPYRNCKYGGV